MDIDNETDALEGSFDLVARQDAAEAAIEGLRGEVDEVKGRLERLGRAPRAPLGGGEANLESKSFVDGYLRHGRETEVKAIQGTVPADGGYAVPREIDAAIGRQLVEVSPIRRIALVVQTGTAGYRKLFATGASGSGWVGETAGRPETATPQFAEIAPPGGELYANPAASQAMLDDAAFDLEAWLAREIATEFARAEGAAFVGGSGVDRPAGFLSAPKSAALDPARPFGTLQYIGSGDASGFGDTIELTLIDLAHALKAGHRQGASWVMNAATLAEVRKLKATDGTFLWQPGMIEGAPDRLLGYPVVEAEDMPDIGAGAFPIAFGNFKAGYLIAERSATTILRDPFTNKPFVHFYATRRVAGQSQRELFVNEAHARIDALLHAAVEGTSDSPPATPADGECWLVGEEPTGAWTDHADALASYQSGGWVFAAPRDGMRVLDNLASQMILYRDGWQRPEAPAAPSGGTTVDAEARTAIAGLVEALITAGILPQV